jgi:hypothetical protein
VQQVAIEQDDRTSGHLDGDRVVVLVREAIDLDLPVEPRVVAVAVRVQYPGSVGAGKDPQAAVVDGGVV